jgi:hypothetical protein
MRSQHSENEDDDRSSSSDGSITSHTSEGRQRLTYDSTNSDGTNMPSCGDEFEESHRNASDVDPADDAGGISSIPKQIDPIMTREVPARLRGLLEARVLSTRISRAKRSDHANPHEETTHLQELNAGVEVRGGEETYMPPRSSPSTISQRHVAIVRVNSRHSGMTANGGEATSRSSTGGRGFNAAALESDLAHASAHAIRPTHHTLQVSPKYGECDESPDEPQNAGRSSFLTAAGKQKVNKFSRETSAYAGGAPDDESIISGEREHGSRPRHRTHSNQEWGDFYNIAPSRSRDGNKREANTERDLGKTVTEPRRRVLPENRNHSNGAEGVQHRYRPSRRYGAPVPELISERRSDVQKQCYSGGEPSSGGDSSDEQRRGRKPKGRDHSGGGPGSDGHRANRRRDDHNSADSGCRQQVDRSRRHERRKLPRVMRTHQIMKSHGDRVIQGVIAPVVVRIVHPLGKNSVRKVHGG